MLFVTFRKQQNAIRISKTTVCCILNLTAVSSLLTTTVLRDLTACTDPNDVYQFDAIQLNVKSNLKYGKHLIIFPSKKQGNYEIKNIWIVRLAFICKYGIIKLIYKKLN